MTENAAEKELPKGAEGTPPAEAPVEATPPPAVSWPAPDERGLVLLGGVHFDRGAVQVLKTEYTPEEIVASLAGSSPAAWVRRVNHDYLERRGIGRLVVAGTPGRPVISGRRFDDRERRGRGRR